jgi:glycerol-3-phosphate dehydrogenase (NAD(P)+)
MEKITIIGAGSWGSALSRLLGDNGHQVILYDISEETIAEINTYHTNSSKLPGGILPDNVSATSNLADAINRSDIIALVVPTAVIREVLSDIAKVIHQPKLFVNAAKGIEPSTYKRVSEIVSEEIPQKYVSGFVALTGPSHAEEVVMQLLTVVAAASDHLEDAKRVQAMFSNHTYFRVYTVNDLVGAELGGSLKNVFALAAGMVTGLGFGDNAKAALITRGLVEMRRLALALGAKEDTLYGLTGLGDLIVTATSVHSRNYQAGIKIAKGTNLEETLQSIGMVVEGARTAKSAYFAAREFGIETPIIDAVYRVIYEYKDVKSSVMELMQRSLKEENIS